MRLESRHSFRLAPPVYHCGLVIGGALARRGQYHRELLSYLVLLQGAEGDNVLFVMANPINLATDLTGRIWNIILMPSYYLHGSI